MRVDIAPCSCKAARQFKKKCVSISKVRGNQISCDEGTMFFRSKRLITAIATVTALFVSSAWGDGGGSPGVTAIFPHGDAALFSGETSPKLGVGTLPERFAIVVGIDHYDRQSSVEVPDLENAEHDAASVASVLEKAGFYTFLLTTARQKEQNLGTRVTRNAILQTVDSVIDYAKKGPERVGRAPVILFYFAGHGFEHGGKSFIVPSDFSPSYEPDIPEMAISLEEISDRLGWASPTLQIIVADACRTPFPMDLVSVGNEEYVHVLTGKLAKPNTIDSSPIGVNDKIIAFATTSGSPAGDAATQKNGQFADVFVAAAQNALSEAKASGTGEQSGIQTLMAKLQPDLKADTDDEQQAEFDSKGATEFLLFPTEADFMKERDIWHDKEKRIQKLLSKAGADDIADSAKIAIYCNTRAFLESASYYSYFGAKALENLKKFNIEDKTACNKVSTDLGEIVVPHPSTEHGTLYWLGKRLAQLEVSQKSDATGAETTTSPVIGDLLIAGISDEAKKEVSTLGKDVPIERVAVNAGRTDLYASPTLQGTVVGSLDDGELVEVVQKGPDHPSNGGDISDSGTLRVRKSNNVLGFVPKRSIDQGRIAVSFTATTHGDQI